MSTPIQHGELSPEDPKFYAPPRWRRGEIVAPPIQPLLKALSEVPNPQAQADWEIRHAKVLRDDERVAPMAAYLEPSEPFDRPYQSGVRAKALAIAGGVVLWTAICIVIALGRLDSISFAHWRNSPPPASKPEISSGEQPQAASVALVQAAEDAPASPQVVMPTLAVADAIGEENAALPLAIKVFDCPPGTTLNLSGLVRGTTLSSGSAAGESQWRIAVDELADTQVIPPADFVGPMTIVAELRGSDDHAIVRSPLQLVWRAAPAAIKPVEAAPATPTPAVAAEVDMPKEAPAGQALAWQKESAPAQVTPRIKVRKNISRSTKESSVKKRHHRPAPALEMETDTVTRWRSLPSSNYAVSAYSDSRMDRRAFWNDDLQSVIDRSWDRCRSDWCRDPRR